MRGRLWSSASSKSCFCLSFCFCFCCSFEVRSCWWASSRFLSYKPVICIGISLWSSRNNSKRRARKMSFAGRLLKCDENKCQSEISAPSDTWHSWSWVKLTLKEGLLLYFLKLTCVLFSVAIEGSSPKPHRIFHLKPSHAAQHCTLWFDAELHVLVS